MPAHRWRMRAFRFGTLIGVAFGAAACASFSPDAGMNGVNDVVARELAAPATRIDTDTDAVAAAARARRLLNSPLSVETAVRLALLDNKGLQAAYNELGIAEAVMVRASTLPSPRISLSSVSTPVELDIERRIVGDILALATLPARSDIAADRFREAQLRAAAETLRVAMETRRRYYRAVAALATAASLEDAVSAAAAAVKLAKELGETGAMNKLDRTREEAFLADLQIQLATARRGAAVERERLIREMGFAGGVDAGFRLPHALPVLPARPRALRDVEVEALKRRLDVRIARLDLDALAKSYGLTKATRFIDLAEVAGISRTQHDPGGASGSGAGADIELEVPIFDFGAARLREASERYQQAVNRLEQKTVNARSRAREAYAVYRASHHVAALYRREVLPLRKTIADEMTLRYGAMQIDVFALLGEAQRRIAANMAAVAAERDFWLASVNLDAAIIGAGGETDDAPAPAADAGTTGNE